MKFPSLVYENYDVLNVKKFVIEMILSGSGL